MKENKEFIVNNQSIRGGLWLAFGMQLTMDRGWLRSLYAGFLDWLSTRRGSGA